MGKIVFVTHAISLYGAAKSFEITLRNLIEEKVIKKSEVIIIYPKSFRKSAKNIIKKRLNDSYFKNFNKKEWILPFNFGINLVNVECNNNLLYKIKTISKTILFYIYWFFKYKIEIKIENIEKVYLNSNILWPMLLILPKKIKIIMHIREMFDFNNDLLSKFVKQLIVKRCFKLIAIDKKTAKVFENPKGKLIIIKNPFDMKKARELKKNKYQCLCKKYKINPKKIHISLIGRISSVKGQDFFCNLVENNRLSNIFEYMIVGKGKSEYINMIFEKTKKIDNLYYLGEIENIDEIYAITHIVIRCDDFFPLGRTVWEGLYSGCKILLPFNKYDDISEIRKYFNKQIFLYSARNINSAISKILEIKNIGFTIDENIPTDNLNIHTKKIGIFFNH